MAESHRPGKLAVILHADIADSTMMVQLDEHLTHERIQDTFRRFSETIKKYQGRVRELRGDALLAEFERASDAVTATLAFQTEHAEYIAQLNNNIRPLVRVGIALGEVIIADSTVTGAGVVLAQRIEQLAEPGGLCITAAIHEALPQRMPFDQENLGEQQVKGFDEQIRVYVVRLSPGATIPIPESSPQAEVAALTLSDKPSIAVLPFTNMSGDPEQEFFGDGITGDIVSTLSRFRNIHVVAFHSTYVYKERKAPISEIAKEQRARYVLEGRIRKSGTKIRINAELIDSKSESICWSETYNRELDDIFAVQDEITMSIVTAMKVHLADGECAREMARDTDNLRAWECCIRAGELADSYIKDNVLEARRLIALALDADPGYSMAWATLGWVNWQEAYISPSEAMNELLDSAQDAAAKALEIDPENTRALTLQAYTHQLLGDDPELAIDKVDQAVAFAPRNAEVLALAAYTYFYAHRVNDAMDLYKSSIRLSPICPSWMHLIGAGIYQRRGELGAAIHLYHQSIDAEPESPLTYYFLIDACMESGNTDKAKEVAHKIRSLDSSINISGAILVYSYDEEERDRLRSNLAKMGFSEN